MFLYIIAPDMCIWNKLYLQCTQYANDGDDVRQHAENFLFFSLHFDFG